ncbi:unnamed protein product [Prunus armeniaca]|uniref:Uncharacterized protein n=1 Tax=Prunus armeniaca TaxID=36596 RepID=A0A6J5UPN8_PRUAR|nr:unnamed protein product [Prunus armeniaca]
MSRTPAIPDTLFQSTLKCLVDVANSETAALASVALQALGHIGLIVPLPSLIIDFEFRFEDVLFAAGELYHFCGVVFQ